MGKLKQNIVKGQKVVAIVRQEEGFKAVCLSKKGGQINVLWTKRSDSNGMGWPGFAAECGLPGGAENKPADDTTIVVGFNCTGVVFYNLDVPAAREDEISKIIRLQTEAKLPLPPEQIEMSFRTNGLHNGSASVTVAAAKKQHLQSFIETVKDIHPEKIVLDCEATAKIWTTFFSDSQGQVIVVNVGSSASQLCLVESGKLSNAVVLDSGTSDFIEGGKVISEAAVEKFARDLSSAFYMFGFSPKGTIPVYILSCSKNGSAAASGLNEPAALNNIASLLNASGINTKVADFCTASVPYGMTGADCSILYDYLVPAGLALMSLDEDKELNIFEKLYISDKKTKKGPSLSSEKKTIIIAAAVLVLTILAFYLLDELGARHLNRLKTKLDYATLTEKYRLSELISKNRPDILGLIGNISNVEAGSIVLDSFDFRKGQPVKIAGTAQSADQLYKFEADLNKLKGKGLERVNIAGAQEDEKTRRLKFTITIDYGNFSKK